MPLLLQQVQCDCGCGAVKHEVNHWWIVGGAATMAEPHVQTGFFVCAWDERLLAAPGGLRFAAGQQCVHKMLDQWMMDQIGG